MRVSRSCFPICNLAIANTIINAHSLCDFLHMQKTNRLRLQQVRLMMFSLSVVSWPCGWLSRRYVVLPARSIYVFGDARTYMFKYGTSTVTVFILRARVVMFCGFPLFCYLNCVCVIWIAAGDMSIMQCLGANNTTNCHFKIWMKATHIMNCKDWNPERWINVYRYVRGAFVFNTVIYIYFFFA